MAFLDSPPIIFWLAPLLCLLFEVYRFLLVWAIYKQSIFMASVAMYRISEVGHKRKYQFLSLGFLLISILGVIGGYYLAGLGGLCIGLTLLLWIIRPPGIFFLGSSNAASSSLIATIKCRFKLLRVSTLVRLDKSDSMPWDCINFIDHKRTASRYEWRDVVVRLMKMSPVLVMDIRVGKLPAVGETGQIFQHYLHKTLFYVGNSYQDWPLEQHGCPPDKICFTEAELLRKINLKLVKKIKGIEEEKISIDLFGEEY